MEEKAKFIQKYPIFGYNHKFEGYELEYEYRGHTYSVEEYIKGNEPLSWQHKFEQSRIDNLIELEKLEKETKSSTPISITEAMNELFEYWND